MTRRPGRFCLGLTLATAVAMLAPGRPTALAQATAPSATPASADPAAAFLKDRGISPDAAGIGEYLRQLVEDANGSARAGELIAQLGSGSFRQREEATKTLLDLPVIPEEALREAAKSSDMEVRTRAGHILSQASTRTSGQVLVQAMTLVQRRKLMGLAPAILRVLPLQRDSYVLGSLGAALRATARPQDADLLRSAIQDAASPAAPFAVAALAAVVGEKAREELAALLADSREPVRLASARELANLGDRRCLDPLCKLLSSQEQTVRAESHAILRALTGQSIRYVPYADAAARKEGETAWRDWVAKEGASAPMRFPLKATAPVTLVGRTLLCCHAQEALIEVDANNVQTYRAEGVPMPWGCQVLPNGHRLVVSHSLRKIFEFDGEGKEVWSKDELPGGPMSVQRLENGNTLVALSDACSVVEYTPQGKAAWQATLKEEVTAAQRLENGNTLVAMRKVGRVVEIDAAGKEVWKLEKLQDPQAIQRLENGNTLIAETVAGKITEYDASGKAVWTRDGFQNPLDCQRLPDGHTIVVDRAAVHELNQEGKEVGTLDRQGLSRAWRY